MGVTTPFSKSFAIPEFQNIHWYQPLLLEPDFTDRSGGEEHGRRRRSLEGTHGGSQGVGLSPGDKTWMWVHICTHSFYPVAPKKLVNMIGQTGCHSLRQICVSAFRLPILLTWENPRLSN